MGINIKVYSVFGIKIDWNDDLVEKYEKVYDDADTTMILDVMGGHYIVLGTILYQSSDFRYNDLEGDIMTSTSIENMQATEKKYRDDFEKKLPQFYHLLNEPFQVITFTHYS